LKGGFLSDVLTVDDAVFWRQLDIISPTVLGRVDISMIGVGGLGSPTAMALAKMGIKNFTVYDHDTVEEHNVPNQMYTLHDIGRPKVEAIGDVISAMGSSANLNFEAFANQSLKGVVIVTVDSMAARKVVWDKVKFSPLVPLLIDARMGAEEGRIFTANPADLDDIERYERYLYSDDEAVDLPCTAQSIIYNTFAVASWIARLVKGYAANEDIPKELILDSVQYAVYRLDS
jgi:hypothetical protein